MDTRQYCTFYVDGLHLGVDVLDVQEVLKSQPMTRVPLAPDPIRGLINLRGQIVTALDLRRRLSMEPREDGGHSMNVVVRSGDDHVSLLVDEIGDVLTAEDARLQPPPATLDPETRALIRGVYELDGRLLLILDLERTLCSALEPSGCTLAAAAGTRAPY